VYLLGHRMARRPCSPGVGHPRRPRDLIGIAGSGEVRLDLDANSRDLLVCDVIPNPPDTSFPQRARQAGATTVDGRGMLLEQAAINIKLWPDIDSDREVMGSALNQAITDWAHP
jgi:shikimate 5-dehydrogenase